MLMKAKAFMNWSSGKDAALALYKIQQEASIPIELLLTTVNTVNNRVSMHGLRTELLLKQAEAIGLPLKIISLNGQMSMVDYNLVMETTMNALKADGFSHSIFGDIFLEDLKAYRLEQLEKVNLKAVFPLWKKHTNELAQTIIETGFKAIVVCTNSQVLDRSFCGRNYDQQFLKDLPPNVDPCGENGEFHSFVYDGPNFSRPVPIKKGKFVDKAFNNNTSDNHGASHNEPWDVQFRYLDLL